MTTVVGWKVKEYVDLRSYMVKVCCVFAIVGYVRLELHFHVRDTLDNFSPLHFKPEAPIRLCRNISIFLNVLSYLMIELISGRGQNFPNIDTIHTNYCRVVRDVYNRVNHIYIISVRNL